jgi:hypothetical protein
LGEIPEQISSTAGTACKLKAEKDQAGLKSTAYEVDAAFALLDASAVAPGAAVRGFSARVKVVESFTTSLSPLSGHPAYRNYDIRRVV